MNPWLGMALVVGALAGLMSALRLYQKTCAPSPEWVRKLLHMGMGLVVLSFPWLFDRSWPVVVLAGVTSLGLLAVRVVKGLRDRVGDVIGGVARESLGEIYFPIAVATLFVLTLHEEQPFERRALLYCIPILVLALADALAALVGVRFGRLRYATVEGHKSTEGSFAFFTVAFGSTYVPLICCDATDQARVFLIGLLLGFLAMMFEAIAWRGLDNLVLPLVSFLLLKSYLSLDMAHLVGRLAITSSLVAIAFIYRSRTTLAGSALLGAVLVGYVSWALGGWHWLLAPLVFFITYTLLPSGRKKPCQQTHTVHAVLCVSTASLIWLFFAQTLHSPELIYPYTLAFAAHLAIIGIARIKRGYPHIPAIIVLPAAIAAGWSLLFIPYLLAEGVSEETIQEASIALVGVALASIGFFSTQPGLDDCPTDTPRWLRQAMWAGVASMAGLLVIVHF